MPRLLIIFTIAFFGLDMVQSCGFPMPAPAPTTCCCGGGGGGGGCGRKVIKIYKFLNFFSFFFSKKIVNLVEYS